ncbi:hypothetical protein JG687_00012613 [Phytophthora cactorum]|uniref:Uncharacterized protein n=1 Tax=Phytophthora cactorum TaxID=29920 RepID=A0A8T1U509_9STRA|nr:hypothetical protein JG687_00012613 [Phytophthora cactorum]
MTFIGIFPLCKVLYDFVPVAYRGVVIFVLSLWKLAAKYFIVYATHDLDDIIPESGAFLVDFFSSLFVSECMSSSGPLYLSFLFIVSDLVQLTLETRELKDNANTLLQLIRQELAGRKHRRSCTPETPQLLATILNVIREPGAFPTKSLESARPWACVPHSLTSEQAEELHKLEAPRAYCPRNRLLLRTPNGSKTPSPVQVTSLPKQNGSSLVTNVSEKSTKLVLQDPQLLFHCEYLELLEYVECIIPIQFGSGAVAKYRLLSWWCGRLGHCNCSEYSSAGNGEDDLSRFSSLFFAAQVCLFCNASACIQTGNPRPVKLLTGIFILISLELQHSVGALLFAGGMIHILEL